MTFSNPDPHNLSFGGDFARVYPEKWCGGAARVKKGRADAAACAGARHKAVV